MAVFLQHRRSAVKYHRSEGFALIASISIMAVLVMIGVALYSLSSVATRSAEIAKARTEAQANAKMALMQAIGQLQENMGPDQRISANASILDEPEDETMDVNHPHWLGVWDSWVAGDPTDAPVNPDYPSEPSQHQTIGAPDTALQAGMAPAYDQKEDHFRKWLVSLDPDEDDALDPNVAGTSPLNGDRAPGKNSAAVRLVGEGSLGPDALDIDFVSAGLLDIGDTNTPASGRYAWWVGDQSQKATILSDSYDQATSLSDAERIHRAQAPDRMGNAALPGFGNIADSNQLDKLPNYKSLDLINLDPQPATDAPKLSQLNFHHATTDNLGVLADVREGGLKRDLNTLLERPINLDDNADEFMLYDFNRPGDTVLEERVPIQDLAAFYQLYRDSNDFSNGGRGGIEYGSNGIQASVPDYGASDEQYLREYTALYRNPVPVKVQFLLGVGASEITQAERDHAKDYLDGQELREDDIYKMSLGVKPIVSLWNPNNVPLVMDTDASQVMKVSFPPFVIQWTKYRAGGFPFRSDYLNLNYAITNESTGDGRARSLDPYIFKIQFAKNDPIVFEPGEVKMFSVDIDPDNWLENDGEAMFGDDALYEAKEYLPDGFYVTAKVAPPDGLDLVKLEGGNYQGFKLVFAEGDKIAIGVYPEADGPSSRRVSRANEVTNSGFQFFMQHADFPENTKAHFRNYQFISKFGGDHKWKGNYDFNADLMLRGFPGGEEIPWEEAEPTPGLELVDRVKGLLMFTMMPGCEVNNKNTGGFSAGRRITTRPFLHGSTLSAPQIADDNPAALYDYGWEWQVERINEIEEVPTDDGQSRGYYGGGYAIGEGTTHVVQQYLPVLPPTSIASLSHAHLGGFSLAYDGVVAEPTDNVFRYQWPPGRTDYPLTGAPLPLDFQQVTATGQGGLMPRIQQAIGNAYAHPNLKPDEAFKLIDRELNVDIGTQQITYADHSYLANKALWDDFFFSSITPQFPDVELQNANEEKTAFSVAQDFLFDDEASPLPNRRIARFTANLDSATFDLLEGQYGDFTDGFADKIAAFLMVSGPFNINSTSVEAWTALFSSLRDKSVAYLNQSAGNPAAATSAGETPVGPGMLPNNEPIPSSSFNSDPNDPPDQWSSWRSLSDSEIRELATAIVKQVKERGPFLSLSEFINRRLDDTNRELAVKGTLQAAIDDDSVSINAAFRTPIRSLDSEADSLDDGGFVPEFPEALDGPIAYGSTPYIDQADILRHLGSVLTPRGDTFVIRTYGDKLDAQGDVVARAWCEAVVQRTPDYLDRANDENHFKQEALDSETNKNFGRKFTIVSFRWLDEDEV